jgi:hypothetical protein
LIRSEIVKLVELGPFPDSHDVAPATISQQELLLRSISPPVTDAEARVLIGLFGPDDYFGCAWTLLHLIETAPHWPLSDCLSEAPNEWIERLIRRAAVDL